VNEINTEISKHWKDIIQKYTSGLFRNATLEFYGIKTAKIIELINTELPVVEVAETSTDFIFLLEDNTYLHFEFQTAYNKSDMLRFAEYDLRLYERDKRKIKTVIIYSADVKKSADSLDIGSLIYTPAKIMMYEYDGNAIYTELETKLNNKQDLTDTDMLNLIFLPLMRNSVTKYELAEKSIELSQTIQDKNKRDVCIASAVAFIDKYLNENEKNKIWGLIRMTGTFARLMQKEIDETVEKKIKEMEKRMTETKKEERVEMATKMLKNKEPIDKIIEYTGLTEKKIKSIQKTI